MRYLKVAVLATALAGSSAVTASATTYTVTLDTDPVPSASGTLRWAIEQANANPGTDGIAFNIAGFGGHTINVDASGLPSITGPVSLDATTQPNYTSTPLIEVNGAAITGTSFGITLEGGASNSIIRGLCINRFVGSTYGVGLYVNGASNVIVHACRIGTDPSGTVAQANNFGVFLLGSASSVIGGPASDQGNVVSGNAGRQMLIQSCNGTVLQGNRIGIGMGGEALGSNVHGITIFACSGTTFGGTGAGEGNIIANSHNYGVVLTADTGSRATRFLGNLFFGNGDGAIDFDDNGPTANDNPDSDGVTNAPIIGTVDAASNPGQVTIPTTLQGLPATSYIVEYYRNPSAANPQATTFLGRTTQSTSGAGTKSFDAAFAASVASGEYITATATPVGSGGTSELSTPAYAPVSLSAVTID